MTETHFQRFLNSALRFKFRTSQKVDRFPLAYRLWRHLFRRSSGPPKEWLVNAKTAVVLEGFPRSGNSFAYAAFLTAHAEAPVIAHHTHRPSQVIAGVKRNLPTLVLIRQPEDAVTSLAIFSPFLSVEMGLRSYIDFYRRLEPHRGSFLLATFDEVVTDFANVMFRLNEKYQTSFSIFAHTDENVQACFRLIERWCEIYQGHYSERKVARPSAVRERLKQKLRGDFERGRVPDLLDQAQELYGRYCQNEPDDSR